MAGGIVMPAAAQEPTIASCRDPVWRGERLCGRMHDLQESFLADAVAARTIWSGVGPIHYNPANLREQGVIIETQLLLTKENGDPRLLNFLAGYAFRFGAPRDRQSVWFNLPLVAELRVDPSMPKMNAVEVLAWIAGALHVGEWLNLGLSFHCGYSSLEYAGAKVSGARAEPPFLGLTLSTRGLLPKVLDDLTELSFGFSTYRYTNDDLILQEQPADIRVQRTALARLGWGLAIKRWDRDTRLTFGAFQDFLTDLGGTTWMAGLGGEASMGFRMGRDWIYIMLSGGFMPKPDSDPWNGNQWTVGLRFGYNMLWLGAGYQPMGFLVGGALAGGSPGMVESY